MFIFHKQLSLPFYVIAALSLIGTFLYLFAPANVMFEILNDRWSLQYFAISPFIHAGLAHFIFNIMALHFIGGQLLIPLIGNKHFIALFLLAMLMGSILNNLFSEYVAVGISAAVMSTFSCSLYRYSKIPMKLLFIHDILRLPPFSFRSIALFIVAIDITGIIFDWHFFAHWGHLGGFATGLIYGYFYFLFPRQLSRR